jgi:hypothetical protein
MNILKMYTVIKDKEKNIFDVYWSKTLEGCGRVEVTVADKDANSMQREIAELAAIRYLLTDKKIFNVVITGPGLLLRTSQIEITRMIGKGYLNAISSYSKFLALRHRGMTVEYDEDTSLLMGEECSSVDVLRVEKALPELIETPSLGKVVITNHAYNRFIEYSIKMNGQASNNPWRNMMRQINNPELTEVLLDTKVKMEKLLKYGIKKGGIGKIYSHPTSTLNFQLTEPDEYGVRHLVTVFMR